VVNYSTARQAIDDSMVWHKHTACWLVKATDTYSKYIILISIPWQQRILDGASVFYTYIYIYISILPFSWKLYVHIGNPDKII